MDNNNRSDVVRVVTIGALFCFAMIGAGCNKQASPGNADSFRGLEAEAAREAANAPPTGIPPGWALESALPVVQADHGKKTAYNCFIYSEDSMGGQKDIAADIPQLGIKRKAEHEVLVLATSEAIASQILQRAFVGPRSVGADFENLRNRGCRPEIPPPTAKASDRPLDQYVTLEDVQQVVYQYYALKGGPVPYEKLALGLSNDYRGQTDAFKKKDMLAQITTQIDNGIAQAKQNPYIHLVTRGSLPAFDFATGSYPLAGLIGRDIVVHLDHQEATADGGVTTLQGPGGFAVRFNAPASFMAFKPENETAARAFESIVDSHGRDVLADIYGKVSRADEMGQNPYVIVDLTKVTVRPGSEKGTTPLFELNQ